MQPILDQIKQLADESEDGRRNIMVTLQNLAYSFETPHDTIHRYGHMNLQAAVVQVGINLGLFKHLAELDEPVTVDQLSNRTGAEPQLMIRLLRFLAAIGAVRETDVHQYAANHVTHNLSERFVEAGISHYFGTVSLPYQSLPDFLEQTGYKNPANNADTAFQRAFNTTLSPYSWFSQNQPHLDNFNAYMALRRQPDATWLSVYPVAEETAGWPAEKPLFVNIGGGVGHQCAQFRERHPDLPGRIVLQDLPHSVAKALPTPGVENMAHDIFKPQPIVGAKFYHLRAVLHNHPPHKVQQILENIKVAMEADSVLLVDEMVFPERGVSFNTAALDMTMLSAFASMERTATQWREAFEDAGLRLVRSYTYYSPNYESVMDVRLQRTP